MQAAGALHLPWPRQLPGDAGGGDGFVKGLLGGLVAVALLGTSTVDPFAFLCSWAQDFCLLRQRDVAISLSKQELKE